MSKKKAAMAEAIVAKLNAVAEQEALDAARAVGRRPCLFIEDTEGEYTETVVAYDGTEYELPATPSHSAIHATKRDRRIRKGNKADHAARKAAYFAIQEANWAEDLAHEEVYKYLRWAYESYKFVGKMKKALFYGGQRYTKDFEHMKRHVSNVRAQSKKDLESFLKLLRYGSKKASDYKKVADFLSGDRQCRLYNSGCLAANGKPSKGIREKAADAFEDIEILQQDIGSIWDLTDADLFEVYEDYVINDDGDEVLVERKWPINYWAYFKNEETQTMLGEVINITT